MLSLIARFKHFAKAMRFASFAIASVCVCSNASFGKTDSSENARTEARFKAAYLAHLLHYSTWDEEDLPSADSTVGLAVVGEDRHHFAQVLLFLLDELKITIQGRKVKVFSLARIPDADEEKEIFKDCAVVYFLQSEENRWSECTLCDKKGVLAIGEGSKYAREGACVSIVKSRNRVKLLINREGYASRNLKVSSRLLRLRSAVDLYKKGG